MTVRILNDKIVVNVDLANPPASAAGLDIALFFNPNETGVIANLTQPYTSLSALAEDFPNTTKINKAANAHYEQPGSVSTVKVGRAAAGDASITNSLDNIWNVDKGFFRLITTTKDETEIEEISDWCVGKPIQFHVSVEVSSDKIDALDETDLASRLDAKGNSNTIVHVHHQAGVDATLASITTAAPVGTAAAVATMTSVAHGLREFDNITVSGAADTPLNGNAVVSEIVDADNFTFSAKGAALGADANNGSIDYFARYEFIEAALEGLQGGKPIGSTAWDSKTLTGQVGIPSTVISDSDLEILRDKNYMTYRDASNAGAITPDGFTVTGEQIKNIDVKFWLEANLAVAVLNAKTGVEQIPYTDKGFGLILTPLTAVMDTQIERDGINPLDNENNYTVSVASALDQDPADVAIGKMPPVEIVGRVGDTVQTIEVNVNLIR